MISPNESTVPPTIAATFIWLIILAGRLRWESYYFMCNAICCTCGGVGGDG